PLKHQMYVSKLRTIPNSNYDTTLDSPFTMYELEKALSKCRSRSALGPDRIGYEDIKSLTTVTKGKILNHYNYIFDHGLYLDEWKMGEIIPIPKPNKDLTQI